MQTSTIAVALVALGFVMSSPDLQAGDPPGGAQARDQSQSVENARNETGHNRTAAAPTRWDVTASQLIGLEVRNDAGQLLGKVRDLVVNLRSGAAPCVVIRSRGTLGTGETRVAVPLKELKWYPDLKMLFLGATKGQFAAASPTPKGAWAALAEEDWAKNIDRFYGQPAIPAVSRFERQAVSRLDGDREFVRDSATTEVTPQPGAAKTT